MSQKLTLHHRGVYHQRLKAMASGFREKGRTVSQQWQHVQCSLDGSDWSRAAKSRWRCDLRPASSPRLSTTRIFHGPVPKWKTEAQTHHTNLIIARYCHRPSHTALLLISSLPPPSSPILTQYRLPGSTIFLRQTGLQEGKTTTTENVLKMKTKVHDTSEA